MKKLVFNREKFLGSSIVIYATFSHASAMRYSMNIGENYSICFYFYALLIGGVYFKFVFVIQGKLKLEIFLIVCKNMHNTLTIVSYS